MNTIQSEAQLENNLIKQLQGLEYDFVTIKDEKELLENLKKQLEIHNFKTLNGKTLTNTEFDRVLNHLNKGNVFERAKILRDKMSLELDNGNKAWIEFINMDNWCQNEFQVTNQITIEGTYKNRYDVTLLINGLPLVQIELKRRGLELKEAFNQTNRYQRHSFGSGIGLFSYVQLFVISNGVNTKYYANNRKQSFKQTFFWSDVKNENITKLEDFTKVFLEPCHISKMITRYIVLNETDKILMVLRPYQYFAVEAIVDRVKNSTKNGYIWHTTGSGKTLTSFKTAQILTRIPEVKKVVFVVDRKDLDYQTTKEFNSFSKGSIDGTDNTTQLVKQFEDNNTPLIVTTIQKLNTAISKEKYLKKMEALSGEKIVFIFDECHRSQFGDTHDRVKKFFTNNQMFGFTGTPIFAENHNNKRTTKDLFEEQLHSYVITDAIKDENVLRFSVEYIGKYKEKSNTNLDIQVEDIDTKELLESPDRLEKITKYIIDNHNSKTHNKSFTAMFCVSSVDTLIKYYELFKKQNHNLKIATIFSYGVNEDDKDADGLNDDVNLDIPENQVNKHSREKLDEFISDYNKTFGTKFSTKDTGDFYNYYNDIAKKVKERQIDILLVVNMFLTGFDSKTLNTLYVDKNLRYHGLVQAFSRTNRILNEQKSQGNIVCFRNLKQNVDDAIALFSNKDAKEIILIESFETYVKYFNNALEKLILIAPSIESVDGLISEEEQFEFVKAFRDLLRLKNILETFVDFSFDKLEIDEQTFEDYKSKYLDIYRKVKIDNEKNKVSILDDVDFELELLATDIINVDYILKLLGNILDSSDENYKLKLKEQVLRTVSSDPKMMSKRDLIERFIEENLGNIKDSSNLSNEFDKFMIIQKSKEFEKMCKEEDIDSARFAKLINDYLYTEKMPLKEEIAETLNYKPKLLERKNVIERIKNKLVEFINIFES
ncbi:type I restriction endonuclease subunit R [Candidatus Gracilibacteria bacterium]|nr:type I restriction endonuclease subunit R [Candidatus Gracilibacteria bacterium]